jgi:hypothetical protein
MDVKRRVSTLSETNATVAFYEGRYRRGKNSRGASTITAYQPTVAR